MPNATSAMPAGKAHCSVLPGHLPRAHLPRLRLIRHHQRRDRDRRRPDRNRAVLPRLRHRMAPRLCHRPGRPGRDSAVRRTRPGRPGHVHLRFYDPDAAATGCPPTPTTRPRRPAHARQRRAKGLGSAARSSPPQILGATADSGASRRSSAKPSPCPKRKATRRSSPRSPRRCRGPVHPPHPRPERPLHPPCPPTCPAPAPTRRKAVTPMSSTASRSRNQRNNPYVTRRARRQLPPQRGRHRLAVAHRTGRPRRARRRAMAARPPDHPHLGRHGPGRARRWLVLAVPGTRRFIIRRFWCVLARHRLQRLCYEARLHTRSGRLPWSCGPARPRSANAPTSCAARASAPRTSTPTSASCAPPATPATPGSPATPAGPSW